MLGLERQPGCVTDGAISLLPTHEDPGAGEQLLLFSLFPGKLSPALLSLMFYMSSAAPKVKGSGHQPLRPADL